MNREERKKYNHENYLKHKRELLASRAKRYRENEAYREGIKQRATVRNALRRVAIRARVEHRTVMHNGEKEKAYALYEMPQFIRRDDMTLYRWDRQKFLPPASYHTKRGSKLYSSSQVMFIKDLVNMYDETDIKIKGSMFCKILKNVWGKTYDPKRLREAIRKETQ